MRSPLAAAAVCLALLALPPLASAKPGNGPALVRRSGQFVILHADGRDGSSTRQPALVSGLRHTPVRAPDDVWIDPGSRVRLEGSIQNGTLVLADSATAVRQLAPSPSSGERTSAAPSTETTAVVLFYWADQTAGQLPTQGAADATMNTGATSLRGYYLEQTYGDIDFQTVVLPPVQFPEAAPTSGDCLSDVDNWAQEALALNPSLDPSQYKHIVYAFPSLVFCGWSGLAEVSGSQVWINGSFNVPVLAHELGHNLGLSHAGGLSCTASGVPAPMGDSCQIDRTHYQLPQYADPFDAMGNAPVLRQMNMEHKLALGVLPPAAVQTVGVSGTYQLAPMETLTGSVELLRLPKPGGGTYFVEYRQPIGVFDAQAGPSVTGVLVHTESPDIINFFGDSDTALIDMHPTAGFPSAQWQDAAMGVGQTFDDAATGISIRDVAQGASGATLAITMPVDTQPPSSPGRIAAVVSGTDVALQWTPAGDNFGVASYTVARDGASLGSTTATTYSDGGLVPGSTVTYAVTATDSAGNVGPAATVSVTLPDTLPPSAPANVTATVGRDGHVHIAWTAATDNIRVVSYRVLRNGTGIAQPSGTAYDDAAPRPGSSATVTYSVIAFDLVGNASPPGAAPPVRAALLRKLGASHLKVSRKKPGRLVRVTGTLSDVKASCRLRLTHGAWHACKVDARGAFSVQVRGGRARLATLLLRDELGRVRQQTLRVP
jgi:chitodextrinase